MLEKLRVKLNSKVSVSPHTLAVFVLALVIVFCGFYINSQMPAIRMYAENIFLDNVYRSITNAEGLIQIKTRNNETRIINNFAGNNTLAIWNQTGDCCSAIRYLDSSGLEKSAIGYSSGIPTSTEPFAGSMYLESSNYLYGDLDHPAMIEKRNNPLIPIHFVTTGALDGIFAYYLRGGFESDGHFVIYDTHAKNDTNLNPAIRSLDFTPSHANDSSSKLLINGDVSAKIGNFKTITVQNGITVKDQQTGKYYCLIVSGGQIKNVIGVCNE